MVNLGRNFDFGVKFYHLGVGFDKSGSGQRK